MPNLQQNNEIEHINKEINLLQDLLKKNEKSQNQFQNGLMQIGRIRVKKGQRTYLSQTKKIQNIFKDIFHNKIKQIEKNTNLLQNILAQVKKRKRLFEKGLKKIAKMQNLSQNELNQIAEMRDQSRDELERIAKIRRIKNYEEMTKEELIISLLKSKQSIAELFNNNNLHDNKISDIRRILSRLRDILPKKDRKEIKDKLYEIEHQENLSEENDEYLGKLVRFLNDKEKHGLYDRDDLDYNGETDIEILLGEISEDDYYKPIFVNSSFKGNYKYYESWEDKEKLLWVKECPDMIEPYLCDLINDHRIVRRVWKIQINMHVKFISPWDTEETRICYVQGDTISIMQGIDTDDIIGEILDLFYIIIKKIIKGSDFVFESVDLLD